MCAWLQRAVSALLFLIIIINIIFIGQMSAVSLPVPSLPAKSQSINHSVRLLQFRPDCAESLSEAGNLWEEVRPKLDDLYPPVEAGLDDVLKHLELTAFTIDMEHLQVSRAARHIVKHSGCLIDFQPDLISWLVLFIFHGKSSLAVKIGLSQINGLSGIP